jgi:hypothetical protein
MNNRDGWSVIQTADTVNVMKDVVAVILLGFLALAASLPTLAGAAEHAFVASSHNCDR